mgnify:CR=1 FL=1
MIVVALDGPSGSGKSSTSKAIAIRAGWNYLDTGALYRAMTFLALSIKSENPKDIISAVIDSPISFNSNPRDPKVFLDGRDISQEIRSHEVTEKVSVISALPEVRAELLTLQRSIIAKADRGIVVEGRDIGTVVCPDAALKIFLTADISARASRRDAELADQSHGTEAVAQSLAARFAAKEALYKALSPSHGLQWHDAEVINHLNEEEARQVPKPIQMNIKLNDIKNIKSSKQSLSSNQGVKYMPDIMAERLVCEILDKK